VSFAAASCTSEEESSLRAVGAGEAGSKLHKMYVGELLNSRSSTIGSRSDVFENQ
jgi:hypothetical protein